MTDYNKINQWYAEQCGVIKHSLRVAKGDLTTWQCGDVDEVGEWGIQDPRCRQICREKFRIDTFASLVSEWLCLANGGDVQEVGDTIEAAELACLVAIYEQRGE
jgi:hypothetical protein